MKVSVSILYRDLKNIFTFAVFGNIGGDLDFERQHFLRNGKDCRDGQIYIADDAVIAAKPTVKTNSVLMYTGDGAEELVPFFEAAFVFRGISVFDIHNAVENVCSVYGDWDSDLRQILGERGTVQQMLDRSFAIFQNPLILYDQNLSTMAFSKEYADDMPAISLMEKKKVADYINAADFNESYAKQKAAFFTPCTAGVRSLYINISRQDKSKCRLMLLEVSRKFVPSDTPLLEHLANLVQSAFSGAAADTSLSDTIKKTLDGEYRDLRFIEQRFGEYGWEKGHYFVCLKIAADKREGAGPRLERLRKGLSGAAVFEHDNGAAVFINLSLIEAEAGGKAGAAADKAVRPALALLEEEKLRSGMSSPFSGFGEFPQHFKQAELALALGSRCRPEERLYRFRDMLELQLLESCTRELPARMVCAPELLTLLRYDEAHNTDYYRTLYVFLENNLRPVQTIKELYIHRSTLLYRLQRIQKITGLDVERCSNRWFLLLSFKLLENEQKRA